MNRELTLLALLLWSLTSRCFCSKIGPSLLLNFCLQSDPHTQRCHWMIRRFQKMLFRVLVSPEALPTSPRTPPVRPVPPATTPQRHLHQHHHRHPLMLTLPTPFSQGWWQFAQQTKSLPATTPTKFTPCGRNFPATVPQARHNPL